ncbi:response regulator transcription factor [Pseudoflavitalea sp. X16]|uniref:response regulator n=1 Tax=Paraflavitalea devenefica TaxID=2716334 RepID=UPI00141E1B4E|nr:response regulator transcription factor [Paraflavitalea devenefica]NII29378.1 response regulator transcription factor [Paraflavitalea devenefica]
METVLIADDHEIVRRGIRMLIESFPEKYHCIEANSCTAVAQILSRERIHYAILDMVLADGNIFSIIQPIEACSHHTSILVYSMNAERIYARRFIEKGVRGFLSKQTSIEELEKAIRSIFKGEVYLSEELKESLLNKSPTNLSQNPVDRLSDRELEVVEYVVIGMGTKEIAQKMNLDITTISTYRRRAFEKLEVQNTIELKEKFLLYKTQAG